MLNLWKEWSIILITCISVKDYYHVFRSIRYDVWVLSVCGFQYVYVSISLHHTHIGIAFLYSE